MTSGVGILITYDEDAIKFSAGVLTDLTLDAELCHQVTEINVGTRIGGFYLSREGDSGKWCLVYAVKLIKAWVDPQSKASAQMLVGIIQNIPEIVNSRIEHLQGNLQRPLLRWTTDPDTWWFLLMLHS